MTGAHPGQRPGTRVYLKIKEGHKLAGFFGVSNNLLIEMVNYFGGISRENRSGTE